MMKLTRIIEEVEQIFTNEQMSEDAEHLMFDALFCLKAAKEEMENENIV